jgi:glycosyltransferase involved in cell wall biosynthesis
MMEQTPLVVSVIVPVFNGAAFIRGAMENINAQHYTPLEIIFVDDGSTDETAKIIADFKDKVRYVYQTNSGPSAARNKGLEIARGKVVRFLDVDDLWPEGSLSLMLEGMKKFPETEIVMGKVDVLFEREGAIKDFIEPSVAFHIGSALFRKEVFHKVGLFDPALRYGEDLDWFMRARECRVSIVVLDQVTLLYRLHETNMTRGQNLTSLNMFKALKKSLDRRREKNKGVADLLPDFPEGVKVGNVDPETSK